MATVQLDPMYTSNKGKLGNIVIYKRYGVLCARSYVIPRNPDTAAQRENRRTFAEAVKLWQKLSPEEKSVYNKKSRKLHMSGYNLFISKYLKENRPQVNIAEGSMIQSREIHEPYPLRSGSVFPPDRVLYRDNKPYMQSLSPGQTRK